MKASIKKLGMFVGLMMTFLTSAAYDFEVDGIYYTITSMADLEVEVSPKEFSEIYYNGGWCWKNITPYSDTVTVPSYVNYMNRTFTVIGIGKAAFGYPYSRDINISVETKDGKPTSVTKVILPSTIRYIDAMAFQGCNISTISLPPSLQTIGLASFAYSSIQRIDIPNSVTNINKSAFYGSSINSVSLGTSVSEISAQAFSNCGSLLEVFCTSNICPDGLTVNTFSGAHPALEIYVPSIANYGFGREYLTFPTTTFDYTGQSHNIEWTNNLKAYKCEIAESDCKTDINAGEYTKYLKATYSNGIDFSVEIPFSYTINKAPMNLTIHNAQREYGEPNPAFTCDISGFVNGENEQSLGTTPAFECEATQLSNVGTYRILASLDAPNYEITYSYGTLSVIKAPIAVSVQNSTKIYGNPNPKFSLSYSGLKNGETEPAWISEPTISTSATLSSGVGNYEVVAKDGNPQNYHITTYSPGTLLIIKRDLTAKVNDCERLYGEENPAFNISYIGFVNGDGESSLSEKPKTECTATQESNAGIYPITVDGGSAENYNFVYQDGTLTVKPLTVGFKDVYNSVTYYDWTLSTTDEYFNYIPEIVGPFSKDDFWIELWFLDKDNTYNQHVATITGGDYAGNYVNTNLDRPMWAGKYIFNLTSKGTNPNVVANPSRAYLTVNRASNNLVWEEDSPIIVKIGEKVDLGITYQADLFCTFKTEYDDTLIKISSEGETGKDPHWYATGLKEGETTLDFSIECKKNEMGFYDFSDSRTVSKHIKVVEGTLAVDSVNGDAKSEPLYVYNLQGILLLKSDNKEELKELPAGLYIVNGKKILVR